MGSCFEPPCNQQLQQTMKDNSKKQWLASLINFKCVHLPQRNLKNHEMFTIIFYQLFSLFTIIHNLFLRDFAVRCEGDRRWKEDCKLQSSGKRL